MKKQQSLISGIIGEANYGGFDITGGGKEPSPALGGNFDPTQGFTTTLNGTTVTVAMETREGDQPQVQSFTLVSAVEARRLHGFLQNFEQ